MSATRIVTKRAEAGAAGTTSSGLHEFVMSTDHVDRMGDIVEQDWDLRDFLRNPIALYQHNGDQPVGRWHDVAVKGGRLMGRLELARRGTSALIDTLHELVAQKILKAVSIGFRPTAWEPIKNKAGEVTGLRYLKNVLLECSLVSVPANQHALATAKSMGASAADLRRLFGSSSLAVSRSAGLALGPDRVELLARANSAIAAADQVLVRSRARTAIAKADALLREPYTCEEIVADARRVAAHTRALLAR